MVALINEDPSKFFDVDSDHFSTTLTMSTEEDEDAIDFTTAYTEEPFLAVSPSNKSTTLQLSHLNKNSSRLSTKGILGLLSRCSCIRELSLPYGLLSEELLRALATGAAHQLETLRVEADPDSKPPAIISSEAWRAFADRSPSVNLVLLSHLTELEDYEGLLTAHVPLSHLYLGECTPAGALERLVAGGCPWLVELVIAAHGPGTLDQALLGVARACPRLASLGLGDCELTCSGLIEFVSLCCERLQVLYVLDTSLLEDTKYDLAETSAKVSSLLGRSWHPNYVPYW